MGIIELWLPILVSAVVVIVMSALVWTVLPWHKTDFKKTGDEEAVRAALKGSKTGLYMVPYCTDLSELKNEIVAQKYIDGPQAYITIVPNGMPNMGPKLALSYAYNVLVGVLCAYMVTRTLESGASYLEIFRVAGTTAFIAYSVAYIQDSIWFGRPWMLTMKNMFDALLYASLTGGVFGWLLG
ncbi:MAG: hypothetical protein OER97_05490 [Gammaproteobacteria bacterium]|nr:hypothetical protein [Gammaproteobacteria bacterium]